MLDEDKECSRNTSIECDSSSSTPLESLSGPNSLSICLESPAGFCDDDDDAVSHNLFDESRWKLSPLSSLAEDQNRKFEHPVGEPNCSGTEKEEATCLAFERVDTVDFTHSENKLLNIGSHEISRRNTQAEVAPIELDCTNPMSNRNSHIPSLSTQDAGWTFGFDEAPSGAFASSTNKSRQVDCTTQNNLIAALPSSRAHTPDLELLYECPFCSEELVDSTSQERASHFNECLEKSKKLTLDYSAHLPDAPSPRSFSTSNVAVEPSELASPLNMMKKRYRCLVCQKDLSSKSFASRLAHLRQCSKRNDVDVRGLAELKRLAQVKKSEASSGLEDDDLTSNSKNLPEGDRHLIIGGSMKKIKNSGRRSSSAAAAPETCIAPFSKSHYFSSPKDMSAFPSIRAATTTKQESPNSTGTDRNNDSSKASVAQSLLSNHHRILFDEAIDKNDLIGDASSQDDEVTTIPETLPVPESTLPILYHDEADLQYPPKGCLSMIMDTSMPSYLGEHVDRKTANFASSERYTDQSLYSKLRILDDLIPDDAELSSAGILDFERPEF